MNPLTGKWPKLDPLDRRLNAISPELTDKRLKGEVDAKAFEEGRPARIAGHFADLHGSPDSQSGLLTQIVHGEEVEVFDERSDWSWVQAKRDSYVGWMRSKNLREPNVAATHKITAPRTFLYPGPDLKLPRVGYRSMGSLIRVIGEAETRNTRYYELEDQSWIFAGHISPAETFAHDYISVAERLVATPYLWGGNTGFGIDCSGLVQLSMRMAGINVLRDSDMQAATIGKPIKPGRNYENLQRGDLIFWRGHVAICQGRIDGRLFVIHANGRTMDVTSEPLKQAIERIAFLYEKPIGVRRPML